MRRALVAAMVAIAVARRACTRPWRRGPRIASRPSDFPADWRAAKVQLERALTRAPRGSETQKDIHWVLRLGARYMRSGQPDGRRRTVSRTMRVNAWWFSRWPAPTDRIIVRDPTGVLSTYWNGRGLAVNPVATSGRWQGLNDDLSGVQLADALLPFARRAALPGAARFLLWEYYDVPDRPGAIRPGASGMAQGRLVHLLANAYYLTGEHRFSDAARGALAAFGVLGGPRRRGEPGVGGRRAPQPALVRGARLPGRQPLAGRGAQRLHGDAAQPALVGRPAALGAPAPRPGPGRAAAPAAGAGRDEGGRASPGRSPSGASSRCATTCPCTTPAGGASTCSHRPGWAWRAYLADRATTATT